MPSADSPRDERVGPFRLVSRIAHGGMGVVHRAEDVRDGSIVALKTVLSERVDHLSSIRREIEALARIRHPGVVRVYESGVDRGVPWYAMELLEGQTLRDVLRPTGRADTRTANERPAASVGHVDEEREEPDPRAPRLDLIEALTLVHRICEPLAFLHGEGVVHRDLKPSNVFLREGDQPVLVDFGLVQRFGGAAGRETLEEGEGTTAGTYLYMSPEQLADGVVDPRADIYALGCILYELTVGRPPFRGNAAQLTCEHLRSPPRPPSALVPSLPPALDALVARMLAKRAADRVGYAADVAAAIAELLRELGASVPAPAAGAPRPRDYLYRPDLAGRRVVLDALVDALTDPERRLVVIRGESGVGKTRLATELARRVRLSDVRVAKGACHPLSDARTGAPLHPFRKVLRDIADHCRARGPDEAKRVLGARASVLAMYEPSLEEVRGLGDQTATFLPSANASRLRLYAWLAETLSAYARADSLVLLVDDVQWADEVSLGFLRAVGAGVAPPRNVNIVCTCRAGDPAEREVLGLPGTIAIELAPLGADAVTEVIGDMIARPEPPPRLVDAVVRRAHGNPLFVGEFLHAAVASGALSRDVDGRWVLDESDAALRLPDTVEALIAARVEHFGQAQREVLEIVAALEVDSDGDELAGISRLGASELLAVTGELIARDVLHEPVPGTLRFTHATLREAVYAGIDDDRRPALHRRIAMAMEARLPALASDGARTADARALALHWDHAGEGERAAGWYLCAAVEAQEMAGSAQACALFERGFELEAPSIEAGPARARVELAYGNALYGMGRLSDAERVLRRVLANLGVALPAARPGWLARIAREGASHLAGSADRGLGGEESELALDALDSVSSILLARADTLGQIGAVLTGANLARRARPSAASALGHGRLALVAGLAGLESVAESYLARAHDAVRAGGVSLPPRLLMIEALLCLVRARWSRLDALVEPSIAICREAGDFQSEVQIRIFESGAAVVRGRVDDCLSAVERALPIAVRDGYAMERSHLRNNLGAAHVLRGDAEAAGAAIAANDPGADPVARTLAMVLDAAVALIGGDTRAAKQRARAALDALAEAPRGSPGYLVHFSFLPAVLCGLTERGEASPALLDVAMARLRAQARVQPAGRPIVHLFEGIEARLAGRARRARARLTAAHRGAIERDLPWVEGAARWELSRLGERDAATHRARAAIVLERAGLTMPPFYADRPRTP